MHNRHFLLQQFHFHQINLLDSMLHSHHIIYFMHKPNCSSDCAHKIFSWISEQQLTSVYKNRVTFVQFHTSFKLNCDKKNSNSNDENWIWSEGKLFVASILWEFKQKTRYSPLLTVILFENWLETSI